MILEAPQSYVNYIESSAHFLNCPTHMFNDDLHGVYRQFYTDPTFYIKEQLTIVLHTFGYTKTKARAVANNLYQFYKGIGTQEFNKLNKNWDVIPERMEAKNRQVTAFIENGTTWKYGMKWSVPTYPFKKGYTLKSI
jgi:hypothetical protein